MTDDASGAEIPTGPHRRYNPLTRRVAARLRRADVPAVARSRRGAGPAEPPRLRPVLLPVPGQHQGQRRAQPGVRVHLRLHQRLRGAAPGLAGGLVRGRAAARGDRARDLPGHLLLAAPRRHSRPDEPGGGASASWTCGRPSPPSSASRYPWVQVFENRGAAMGASNPASARPDLGRRRAAARGRQGRPRASAVLRGDRPSAAARLRGSGERRPARGRRRRRVAGGRAVLGRLAVRDAGHPAAARGATARARRAPARLARRAVDRAAARLRRALRHPVPVLDGLAPGPVRRPAGRTGSSTPTSTHRSCRSTMRKFMVGYELLSEPQRDITAEAAAERLRTSIQTVKSRRLERAGSRRKEPTHVRTHTGTSPDHPGHRPDRDRTGQAARGRCGDRQEHPRVPEGDRLASPTR